MNYARVDRAVRQRPFFFLLGFDEGVALSSDSTSVVAHVGDASVFSFTHFCHFSRGGGEWTARCVCHPFVALHFDRVGLDVWHNRTAPVDASVANQGLC